jgi:hypothetical protein
MTERGLLAPQDDRERRLLRMTRVDCWLFRMTEDTFVFQQKSGDKATPLFFADL